MLKKYTVIGVYGDNNQIVSDEVEAASGPEALEAVLNVDDGEEGTRGSNSSYRAIAAIEGVELNITYND
jgi:hypothetical protein